MTQNENLPATANKFLTEQPLTTGHTPAVPASGRAAISAWVSPEAQAWVRIAQARATLDATSALSTAVEPPANSGTSGHGAGSATPATPVAPLAAHGVCVEECFDDADQT